MTSARYQNLLSRLLGVACVILLFFVSSCLTIELGDKDGDGFSSTDGDCNDGDASVHPGVLDLEDGLDNDCDKSIDEDADSGDGDGDQFGAEEGDCDDSDPSVYPNAAEVADGIDNDCDGEIDETATPSPGSDGDGDGYSSEGGDCDDTNPAVNPGAPEVIDGIDNDCDGLTDEELTPIPESTPLEAFEDDDEDGYSSEDGDCDDTDPSVYPGAIEVMDGVDNDCDGQTDPEGTPSPDGTSAPEATPAVGWDDDVDQDGYSVSAGDCDDNDPSIHPDASDWADGIDNDCDGTIDEDATDNVLDQDGDGFNGPTPDCDDDNAAVYPGAMEVQDGVDNDCDGQVDESSEIATVDIDGDGFSSDEDCNDSDPSIHPGVLDLEDGIDNDCDGLVDEDGDGVTRDADEDGYSVGAEDCNDRNNSIYPGAAEQCNGVDDDCDGQVDEDLPVATYFMDRDGDGYGVEVAAQSGCLATPAGFTTVAGDCNDTDPTVNPGAQEHCNGIDDDCDREVDEDAVDATVWYPDEDGDGYGNGDKSVEACLRPAGFVSEDGDCDDSSDTVYPGAPELDDKVDNDCDHFVDEN